jgi:hypothetical protein
MRAQHSRSGKWVFWGLAVVMGIFVMAGCGGGGGGGGDTSAPSGSPSIVLSTDTVLFPNTVLERTSNRQVVVENTGTANLNIGSITPPGEGFDISGTCSNSFLAPNESCTVIVSFTPIVQRDYAGEFEIPSNAGNRTVSVSGTGQGLNVTINRVEVAYPEIKLLVSVTDKDNLPITPRLGRLDFSVIETGLSKDGFVLNDVTSPVSVVLALDYSGSIVDIGALNDIEMSAKEFLKQLNPGTDQAAVIKFGAEVHQAIGLTSLNNRAAIDAAIDADFPYLGEFGTKLFEAAFQAVDLLNGSATTRNVVIVVSDFREDRDTRSIDEVIDNAMGKTVPIFTIGFGERIALDTMERTADETGGEWFLRPQTADLHEAYTIIAEILNDQYELLFTTDRDQGSVNDLTVEVDNEFLRGDDTILSIPY